MSPRYEDHTIIRDTEDYMLLLVTPGSDPSVIQLDRADEVELSQMSARTRAITITLLELAVRKLITAEFHISTEMHYLSPTEQS